VGQQLEEDAPRRVRIVQRAVMTGRRDAQMTGERSECIGLQFWEERDDKVIGVEQRITQLQSSGMQEAQVGADIVADERRIAPDEVESAALEEPGVLEAHNVRSRGLDDDIHLDLHILVDPRMEIAYAHQVGHRVERRLRDRWPGLTDVVVHVEPALERERARIREGGGLKAED
jgi:hypothetical protein